MIKLFQRASGLLDKIEQAGYEAYFVGGAVRDMLLKKPISDVDIATSATPLEVKAIFPNTVDVGIEHGTVIVIHEGEPYEVTTFRREGGYEDFRRPSEVKFIRSLREDLQRRDFTMNAIAMDKGYNLIDPFSGASAIRRKLICTVGDPDERFSEDALRMMRAVRFVSQLSFSMDPEVFEGIKKNGPILSNMAVERLLAEFNKLMEGRSRTRALEILLDSGLYQYVPGLPHQQEALRKFIGLNPSGLKDGFDSWVLLTSLMNQEGADAFLNSWRMPMKQFKSIKSHLVYLNTRRQGPLGKKSLFEAGRETAIRVERVFAARMGVPPHSQVETAYDSLPVHHMNELGVNGNDLLDWTGKKGGPWVKELLSFILTGVLEERVKNDKKAIREWLVQCNRI
ncbi:CCA tRNA nucleotidyltransferase [Peribacillus sp. SCS-37]|uniref:CCA tRNA nucleotidyltransferase n=1 Tax=Paraperibacillus esterisolvens TaxID=3115296 RepID=UPI0039067C0E